MLIAGFESNEVERLLRDIEQADVVDDDAPPLPAAPETRPGDLYELGRHRLLCGDATVATDVERLMDGERASMLWTDPPYGVDYVGKTKDALTIENDGAEGLVALLRDAFAMANTALSDGAAIYIAHPAGARSLAFGQAVVEQGWRFHQSLVWVKDALVLGHSDYHYRHEPVILAYKPGGGRRGRGGKGWYGDNRQDTIFEVPRPKASREHPTSKPPALIAEHLRNSSRRNGIVLDVFGGSGSTLVAAEGTGRSARLLELDPRYCDVIVQRWEALTGEKAKRVRP